MADDLAQISWFCAFRLVVPKRPARARMMVELVTEVVLPVDSGVRP